MSSKNNSFTAGDIERYHSGKMSMQERHALEKAALDDPFLADALDGYEFSSAPTEDLVKIQTKLDEKLNRKKVIPLFQKYKWISVAAMVVIIAAAGWLVYSISGNTTDSLAVSQEKNDSVTETNSVSAPQIKIDSGSTTGSESASVGQQTTLNQQAKTALGLSKTKSKDLANNTANQPVKAETAQQESKDINSDAATSLAVQNEAANKKSFSRLENKNAGRNNATVVEPGINKVSEPPSARSMASDNATVKGKRNEVNERDSVKNINVVLHPLPTDSSSLREVVVVAYGSQKKSSEKYPRVIIDTLEPAEGYVKFDDYIASNLKMPEELKTKTVSGEVQLSFDVNKEGQPVNIKVEKSLCQKCDEEAVRLLKDGPKWKKKKNKKGKLTIKF